MRSFGQWTKTHREARGFSQEELGLAIQRSKSWVADLERGKAKPKTEDIRQICLKLNISLVDGLAVFLQELIGGVSTDSLLELETVAQRWADDVIAFDQDRIERVKPRSRRKIEQTAESLVQEIFGDDVGEMSSVPIDLLFLGGEEHRKLCAALGTSINFKSLGKSVPFDASTSQGVDGGLEIGIRRDVWRLIEKGDGRARFTLAHELGHAALHKDEVFNGGVVYRDGTSMASERLRPGMKIYESPEWQANTFASAFLMPTRAVEHWLSLKRMEREESISLAEFSAKFDVSYEAARIRVERLLAK